jgi:serine/threonine protein kinase/tetratricopeptide (TPR) repeat protein
VDRAKLQADEIFCAAVELASPEERAAYLGQVCGDDLETRRRVEHLLKAHSQAGDFLASPPAVVSKAFDLPAESAGTVIGPYKLLQPIGEGGMGAVWMAQQAEPVKRLVALKLIKPGMDSKNVLARFNAERQALALMDHPNIARVFDGGTTKTSRPFFVMELVKGVPLTKYCDEHRLTPHQRLELFIPVCQAIQHAHQKGIIHRDIKPSNVLVALYDGKPVPKVIDFGVAKALGQQLAAETLVTGFGNIVGTLEYMSPEQAEINQLDIDTRSDIYSLGVVLYELLTGSTPLDKSRLKEAAFVELLRVVREVEPPRPSTRLSASKDSIPSISAQRHMEPAKLTKLLRGDLDWIVMKALDKDRSRRYESAGTFAADIERYLKNEPVSAGPPGAGYRLRKFLRRNRGPVLAASLVILALVVGVIGTSLGLVRARQAQRAEADRADGERRANETARQRLTQIEKANEILGSVFKNLNPLAAATEGKELQVLLGERLDQATAQLEGEVVGDSLAVARMQSTLGVSQLNLGYAEKAIHLLSKARTTFTARLGADHHDTLTSVNNLAMSYQGAGRPDLALPLFKETLERRKATLGPDDPDTLVSVNNLGLAYYAARRFDLALPLYEEAFERRKAKFGADDPDTLISMNNLALGYKAVGKLGLALPLYEESLKLRKAKFGADHPQTLSSMNNLAAGYLAAGELGRAQPLLEETLRLRRAKLGPDHPLTLNSMNNLAHCYKIGRQLDLAMPLYEETVKLAKGKLGPDHPDTLMTMNNLAGAYQAARRFELALPLYEETLTRMKPKLGHDHPDTLLIMNNLGKGYVQTGQTAKAVPILRECLAIWETKEPDGWKTFDTKSMLGAALVGEKRYAEAEPLLLGGYEGMRRREATIPPVQRVRLIEALRWIGQLYDAWGKADEAAKWRKELEARRK